MITPLMLHPCSFKHVSLAMVVRDVGYSTTPGTDERRSLITRKDSHLTTSARLSGRSDLHNEKRMVVYTVHAAARFKSLVVVGF